jgi:hypothetical protein
LSTQRSAGSVGDMDVETTEFSGIEETTEEREGKEE